MSRRFRFAAWAEAVAMALIVAGLAIERAAHARGLHALGEGTLGYGIFVAIIGLVAALGLVPNGSGRR